MNFIEALDAWEAMGKAEQRRSEPKFYVSAIVYNAMQEILDESTEAPRSIFELMTMAHKRIADKKKGQP